LIFRGAPDADLETASASFTRKEPDDRTLAIGLIHLYNCWRAFAFRRFC